MQIYFIGCRASSEAIEKYMHTAFAIEINGNLYWFDAGEGCSDTAHLMGVNLLKIREIFISHPHMDHVGGLCNLIWTMRKLVSRGGAHDNKKLGVHISDLATWEGICKILYGRYDNDTYPSKADVKASQIVGGDVYKDENISVFAVHNGHMEKKETDIKLSFSFDIYCENKRIVYSGDIKGLSDLDELLKNPCDYLLIESGHQTVEEICEYVNQKNIGTVVFLHHRRDVIENITASRILAQKSAKCKVCFAQDGDIITI